MHHAPLCPLEIFKKVVTEHGFDLASKTSSGDTVIFQFCDRDNIDCLQWSAEHGANIQDANNNGETTLHRAAQHNSKHSTEYLIKHYADINIKDKKGNTPLHMAASWDQLETVQMLVAAGADINARNNAGHNIFDLVIANLSKSYSKIKPLLRWLITECGMDVNYKYEGKTPLYALLTNESWKSVEKKYGDHEGANWLIDLGGTIQRNENDKILKCSFLLYFQRENSLALLQRILEKKMEINVFSLLVSAANGCKNSIIETIVKNYQFDINRQRKRKGTSVLHRCVFGNHFLKTVQLLLSLGANPNLPNASGQTALHEAAKDHMYDADKIVNCLITAGAKVNIQDNKGNTPLHIALDISKPGWECVRILLNHKADITIKNAAGQTAGDIIRIRKLETPADIKDRIFINEVKEEATITKPSL